MKLIAPSHSFAPVKAEKKITFFNLNLGRLVANLARQIKVRL